VILRSIAVLLAALLLPPAAAAQSLTGTPPGELAVHWSRFSDAWTRGDLPALLRMVTPDVEIRSSAGTLRGEADLRARWDALRLRAGYPQVPAAFHVLETRVVETGTTHVVTPAGWRADMEETMCDPEEDTERPRAGTYSREWVRGTQGSWRVSALVVH
jgi:ketosteroid isomerase-like protein